MARVIRHLNSDPENRPAVIGIDMLFSAESRTDPKGDRELAEACAEYGNVAVAGWANYGTKVVRDADNWALEWIGFLPGKRESRRYVGDCRVL